ncbi:efflux RND transporter periplasmic adaptor subunit [Algicola sagamiensis]|uniref:efflux RND transporter periplasmic adaptor subunit n=1 Tax=Algicola sagamiensis TaxID=163869 RepID=UPI00036D47A7|nr:efflux RND transporter periplasmic adaptor subunit [Algicola sagamiensis]
MTTNKSWIMSMILGGAIGAGVTVFLQPPLLLSESSSTSDEKNPLYWVAPMDSNYRRDKPGKSPMGMDLIPVYEESSPSEALGPGAVYIKPHVVHNLGVRTALVKMQHVETAISTVGYVQYDEDKLVHIHPRVEGWIEKLYVKAAGDPVNEGAPLYTLYSPQLVNAQEEFLIALRRSNRTLIQAAKERLQSLQLTPKFIKSLEKTRKVQPFITFYAPQSGVLDGLKIREGFYVQPGNTLMSIGQLSQVWVQAEVYERDAAHVQKGLPVSMTLDYLPGKMWLGVVDYVYPVLDAKTRTLRVRLRFDNQDQQLKPNMFAQVVIHASSENETLLVPKESVIRTGKQDRVVLALGHGQFKSIAVKIGRVSEQDIEILEGIREGDEIVTSAQFLIDSESSKSSDFKRMSKDEIPQAVSSATVEGTINSIDLEAGILNISRGPIAKWSRPAATMDFHADQSIDLSALKDEMKVKFTFEIRDDFVIVDIQPMEMTHEGHEHQQGAVL